MWPGPEALPTALLHRRRRFNDYLMQCSWKLGYQARKRGVGGDGSTVAKWYCAHDLLALHKNDLGGLWSLLSTIQETRPYSSKSNRVINSNTGEYIQENQ